MVLHQYILKSLFFLVLVNHRIEINKCFYNITLHKIVTLVLAEKSYFPDGLFYFMNGFP